MSEKGGGFEYGRTGTQWRLLDLPRALSQSKIVFP